MNIIDTNGKTITVDSTVSISNFGTEKGGFSIVGGGTFTSSADLGSLSGKIYVGGNSTITLTSAGGWFDSASQIHIDFGSTITANGIVDGTMLTLGKTQTITGSGAFLANGGNHNTGLKNSNILFSGTLAPSSDDGLGAGSIRAQGTFNTTEDCVFAIDIFSLTSYDQIDLSYTNSLGVRQFFDIVSAYDTPTLGTIIFDLAKMTSVYGEININDIILNLSGISLKSDLDENGFYVKFVNEDNVKGGWRYDSTSGSYFLTFASVPEPSTYTLLFAAFAICFAAYSRKKF